MRVRSLALLAVLVTLNASAQQHRESVTVEVIDVPVYVSRGTTPVAGLTRDDFELYVNGRRQPIEYFDSMAAADGSASMRERRLFLLLFDLAFSHPHAIVRAQRAAAAAIEKGGPRDYFAVATYSSRRGIWFAVPFTRDHPALTRAVANLSHSASGDPLSLVLTSAERASELPMADDAMRDIARERNVRLAETQVLELGDLAERLAPLDGEKHVVLLTEGYDGREIHPYDVRKIGSSGRGREIGEPRQNAFGGRSFDHKLVNDITSMHQVFQRENVLLHAIDLEGVTATLTSNDALNLLVKGTGGHFVFGQNDPGVALSHLSGKLASGYRLGFRPVKARSGYNTISVKIRNARGTHVNHRQGFFGTPRRGNTHDGVYLADILLNDVPQTGTAAVLALHDRTLTATIPMRELAAQLPASATAELLLYAFDATGTAVLYHRHAVRITDAAEETVEVTVPEGTRVAKALLRVDGMLGFSRVGG
jgi:VWFA-related protein